MNELNCDKPLKMEKVEKRYIDPPLKLQRIGLFSFTPSKGATPDKDGFFGFAKIRGNFETEEEANERAEFLIRNIDSYNKIYHTYVGRPFPVTQSSEYSEEVKEIDIHKKMGDEISADVKQKREQERKEILEIKEREKNLQKEVVRESENKEEIYTTLKTKKAQLVWTYLETLKKIDQMKESIVNTRKEIEKMDAEDSELKETFFEKYMKARKDAGFKDDDEKLKGSFMQFMIEDVDLGF